ncbi:hypothetical protein ScPMuIL_007614 [Solemya velum]
MDEKDILGNFKTYEEKYQTVKESVERKRQEYNHHAAEVDLEESLVRYSLQENMRNTQLKNVRQEWKHSRFYFGKNKVMALALGRTESEEYREKLHQVCRQLKGQTGLLFTNETKDKVLK